MEGGAGSHGRGEQATAHKGPFIRREWFVSQKPDRAQNQPGPSLRPVRVGEASNCVKSCVFSDLSSSAQMET